LLNIALCTLLAAPSGYGSADGKVGAKVPVARPVKRSGPKKDTVGRKEAVDSRRAVVVSALELEPGATLPEGADFAALVAGELKTSTILRLVAAENCVALDCMRKVAAAEQSVHLMFASLAADGRLTLLLNELPGRGLLRKRVTAPLEAKDQFDAEVKAALRSILGLGTIEEGVFKVDPQVVLKPVVSEDLAAADARQKRIEAGTYTVYAGAGLFGLGLSLGMMATVNASQWRSMSFRNGDGAYREQIRGVASGRAFAADLLLVSGLLAGGGGYFWQRRAVAGPGGAMTVGWGQDTWKEPEPEPEPGFGSTTETEGETASEAAAATATEQEPEAESAKKKGWDEDKP
jgi:hypothetical protein